jgi:TRAP transporter TAXI family solute receptor
MIQDGHADMAINNIAEPAGPFLEMQLNVPLVFLSIDEDGINYLTGSLAHIPHTIRASTYKGQDSDLQTAAMFSVHVINADVPEEIVYSITKTICENEEAFRTFAANTKTFTASTAFEGCGIPLHPGAERYFKEMSYLK